MSKITVTTIAGLTSGGNANKVIIESGDTLQVDSNATVGGTLGVTGASTLTGATTATGGVTIPASTTVGLNFGSGTDLAQLAMQSGVNDRIALRTTHTSSYDNNPFIVYQPSGAAAQNDALVVNTDGEITKGKQPSFSVGKSGNQNNIGVSSYDQVTFDTEAFDIGSNFASNVFTAPVTGKYHLTFNLRLDNVDTAASYYNIGINTSNRSYYQLFQPNHPSDVAYYVQTMTVIADMDANDTASCSVNQHNGTSQTDINTSTVFMGILIG